MASRRGKRGLKKGRNAYKPLKSVVRQGKRSVKELIEELRQELLEENKNFDKTKKQRINNLKKH